MIGTRQGYYDKVLARVGDSRRRAALARLIEESDEAIHDMAMEDALAKDEAAKKAQKARKRSQAKAKVAA